MNQQAPLIKRRLMVAGVLFILFVVIITIIYLIPSRVSGITNLESCSPNISTSIKEMINNTLYYFIKDANEHNGLATQDSYTSTIREGSCEQTDYGDFSRANMIVDVPGAQQSWRVEYDWIENGVDWFDTGDIAFSCLDEEDLIYGDFDCKNMTVFLSGQAYTLSPIFPIEKFLPYIDRYYTISLIVTSLGAPQLTISFNMPEPTRPVDIQSADKYKRDALGTIRGLGFDPEEFDIVFTWQDW